METHTPMNSPSHTFHGRWLVRTGDGTLQYDHETARAVRRRLHLSPRQYRKQLKAALRSGDGKQLLPFMRREVSRPQVQRRVLK